MIIYYGKFSCNSSSTIVLLLDYRLYYNCFMPKKVRYRIGTGNRTCKQDAQAIAEKWRPCVCVCVCSVPPSATSRTNQPCVCKRPTKQQRPSNNNTTNTTKTDALSTNRPPTVHLTSVQTNSEGKEQDQKMPRKSGRKIKPDGVADPLAAHDDDQAALDAGEVSRSWLMCTS